MPSHPSSYQSSLVIRSYPFSSRVILFIASHLSHPSHRWSFLVIPVILSHIYSSQSFLVILSHP